MSPTTEAGPLDLTIVLPTRNEAGNLRALFDGLAALASESRISYEVLVVDAGSTRLLEGLPQSVGLDLSLPELRYREPLGRRLVQGEPLRLPFADATFDAVAAFEPDDELERGAHLWQEVARVLKPKGRWVYGTRRIADGEHRLRAAGFRVTDRSMLMGRLLLPAGERGAGPARPMSGESVATPKGHG